jgi:dTDP-4-dehydrorhamnose reductase
MNDGKRILILGASGMLGSTLLRWFMQNKKYKVFGSVRNQHSFNEVKKKIHDAELIPNFDVGDMDSLTNLFAITKPDIVVNCIGIVKQLAEADDPLITIPVNSLLPHRLARLAQIANARLVHMSTDCVFSGKKGDYSEEDIPDAYDLYGLSKLIGEVDYPNAITLRTSIIGHELVGGEV